MQLGTGLLLWHGDGGSGVEGDGGSGVGGDGGGGVRGRCVLAGYLFWVAEEFVAAAYGEGKAAQFNVNNVSLQRHGLECHPLRAWRLSGKQAPLVSP